MNFEDLSPELQQKARDAQTPADLVALAEAEGYELSDEELEAISGGKWYDCKRLCSDCPFNF